jgi:hypothetical protein
MSSLFSDPPFSRGNTLLNGELVELDANGSPIAGKEIVGSVKVFPDIQPGTGPASVRNSNRLAYCVAARYTGASTINTAPNYADKSKWYVLSPDLTEFNTLAATTDVTNGRIVGVLDEYLNQPVRPNDVVWLVVKGPATALKSSSVFVNVNAGVQVSSGLTVSKTAQGNIVAGPAGGNGFLTTTTTTAAQSSTGTGVTITANAAIAAGQYVSGTSITEGTTVSSVSGTTLTLSAASTANIANGATLTFWTLPAGTAATDTTVRVNVFCNEI